MKKIGITGGIGSGKSTVSKIFSLLGVPVYFADDRAKYLLNHQPQVIEQIKEIFGNDIYSSSGIDRKKLAQIVFNNPDLLQKLNAVVHPAVFDDFENWCKQYQHLPYILKEAALIYETIIHQQLDKVIVVTAPEAIRIKRVMLRDNATEAEIRNRIKNQLPESEKISRADFLIYNDEKEMVIPQVLELNKMLKC